MELQRTQQRMFTRCLVALLVATSGMSVQETRAVSLFSMQKTAVVAPTTSGFVDFIKENRELTAITSVVLAGVISYAIYQMWFAPKTPISKIIQMRRARFDEALARQRQMHQVAQPHLVAMSKDNKKIMAVHLRRTHAQVAEGLGKALVVAIGCDESDEGTIDFRRKLNEAMETFQEEILKNCAGKVAIAVDQAIVKRTCNEMSGGLSQEDQESCLFLEASLQEYAGLLVYMAAEERKYMAEFIAYIEADAAKHPKEEVTQAFRDVKVEQERLKKLAEAHKIPSQNSAADMQQDVVHGFLTSVDWKNTPVEDVFKRGQEQFKALQKLFPVESKDNALFLEEAVRGNQGIFVVLGTVLAHKICEIVCGKDGKIEKGLYEELFDMLRKSEIKAFNDVNFDFAREGLRDTICQKLEQNAPSKAQQDALMALLVSYRDFIREIRGQLDAYLIACGCASDNGNPCTAAFSSQAYIGTAAPLLNWPYVAVKEKKAPVEAGKPRDLKIKSDNDVSDLDSESERSHSAVPLNDWSSVPALSSASYPSETSSTPLKNKSKSPSFSRSQYRYFGSSSSSSADVMKSSSTTVVAPEVSTIAASTTTAASSTSSSAAQAAPKTAAPAAVPASEPEQAHKCEQAGEIDQKVQEEELQKRLGEAIRHFASAAKKDRASKKEAIEKAVVALLNAKMGGRVSDVTLHNANNVRNLRGRIDRELTFIAKDKEIDEAVVLKKLEAAIKTCEVDLLRQGATQRSTLPKKAKRN